MALAPFVEIAPLWPEPPIPVDDGIELEPDAVVVAFVVFVAFAANLAPISNAIAKKLENELLLPSGPGLTANTMPFPQWLSAVFAACSQ